MRNPEANERRHSLERERNFNLYQVNLSPVTSKKKAGRIAPPGLHRFTSTNRGESISARLGEIRKISRQTAPSAP